MRPVNLIPPEDRRGDRAPMRTGPVAYVLVGALALALAGVTGVVLTSNQISERKAELAELQARDAAAKEHAEELAPYAQFAALKEARVQTVDSLARSRFDWERVLRELAIVIPPEVQLTNVTGTVAPDVALTDGGGNSLRDSAAGPALEISGCAPSHDVVAALAAALEDIDGVTRVGVNGSAKTSAEGGGSIGGAAGVCPADDSVTQFQMIAAFDAVSVPAAAPESVPATPEAPAKDSGQIADAEQTEAEARESVQEGTDRARDATNIIPGTIR